ncbi:methyl-accepting chemotaxis protein, partial [Xanthomonas sp. Kuri4-3]
GQISYRMDESLFPGDYARLVRDTNRLVGEHIDTKMRTVALMQRYAVGDLSESMPPLPGEKQQISDTMATVQRNLGAINAEVKRLAGAAAAGDFSVRGDAAGFEYDFRAMIEDLNQLMATADTNLAALSQLLRAIADGDLTQRMDGQFHGVFATMRDDANATVRQLADIVARIQRASASIDGAANEIAVGNQDLSRRTEQQAASLEETAASMEELTS